MLLAAVLFAGNERGTPACLCRPNSGTLAARLRLKRSWLIALPLKSLTADLPVACSSCGAAAELGRAQGSPIIKHVNLAIELLLVGAISCAQAALAAADRKPGMGLLRSDLESPYGISKVEGCVGAHTPHVW